MAPEMIRHELYTSKADVYSWGVMLAEILSQRPPYEGLYLTPVQVTDLLLIRRSCMLIPCASLQVLHNIHRLAHNRLQIYSD